MISICMYVTPHHTFLLSILSLAESRRCSLLSRALARRQISAERAVWRSSHNGEQIVPELLCTRRCQVQRLVFTNFRETCFNIISWHARWRSKLFDEQLSAVLRSFGSPGGWILSMAASNISSQSSSRSSRSSSFSSSSEGLGRSTIQCALLAKLGAF